MRRHEVKECQKTISDYLSKSGFSETQNGNTPSPLSPTNSVGSQVIMIFNVYLFSFFKIFEKQIFVQI